MRKRVFGSEDEEEAKQEYKRKLAELSKNEKIRDAASATIEDPETKQLIIKPANPKYCQCWLMELDDSPFSQWALACGEGLTGRELLKKIDVNLPPRVN